MLYVIFEFVNKKKIEKKKTNKMKTTLLGDESASSLEAMQQRVHGEVGLCIATAVLLLTHIVSSVVHLEVFACTDERVEHVCSYV